MTCGIAKRARSHLARRKRLGSDFDQGTPEPLSGRSCGVAFISEPLLGPVVNATPQDLPERGYGKHDGAVAMATTPQSPSTRNASSWLRLRGQQLPHVSAAANALRNCPRKSRTSLLPSRIGLSALRTTTAAVGTAVGSAFRNASRTTPRTGNDRDNDKHDDDHISDPHLQHLPSKMPTARPGRGSGRAAA